MKKLIIALLLTPFLSISQSVEWMSFEEAMEANKNEPKKILIDVYTDWCGWCKKMDKDTYANPVVAKFINENYYPIKLDAETKDTIRYDTLVFVNPNTGRRSSHQLAVSLMSGKMSYPTTLIMNEEVKIIQKIPGYLDAATIEPLLHYFYEDMHTQMPYDDYKAKFSSSLPEQTKP